MVPEAASHEDALGVISAEIPFASLDATPHWSLEQAVEKCEQGQYEQCTWRERTAEPAIGRQGDCDESPVFPQLLHGSIA